MRVQRKREHTTVDLSRPRVATPRYQLSFLILRGSTPRTRARPNIYRFATAQSMPEQRNSSRLAPSFPSPCHAQTKKTNKNQTTQQNKQPTTNQKPKANPR